MNIKPRKDVKDLSIYKKINTSSVGKSDNFQNKGVDILTEACLYHKIDKCYVEKVKQISDKSILITFRAPVSRKILYEQS